MPIENMLPGSSLVQIGEKPAKVKNTAKRGCEHCPLNERKDLNKVFGKIRGKDLFIFGMCPGEEENKKKKPFKGRAGHFLWSELKKVGIHRKDVDVDNVVRCYPSDRKDGQRVMRNPTNNERRCCSVHTDNALRKSKAKVYLVLGMVAGKQLLGAEYRASTRIMWSEKLQAKVYCLYHPSYFIRGNMQGKAIEEWRKAIASLAEDLKGKTKLTPYGYVESRDYKAIHDAGAASHEAGKIRHICKRKKIRVAIDLEDDVIDGVNVPLVIGTCFKKGRSRVFYLGTWEVRHGIARNFKFNPGVVKAIVGILEDPNIEKVCHHGSYDVKKIEQLLGCHIKSYTYDTEYACYLADPNRKKSPGLDALGLEYYPKFGEYKTIILPDCLPKGFDYKQEGLKKGLTLTQLHDYISAKGMIRLAQLPEETLVTYNGADCDLTKHLEVFTKNRISLPLLRVYVDAAFTIDEMTPNGPKFDYDQLKKLRKIFPPRLKRILKRIRQIAGKPDFNPSSYPQVAWLFVKKLKLLRGEVIVNAKGNEVLKCSTDKGSLESLARKHEIAALVLEYRRIKKILSTYMDSFEECANANDGKLRTKWWLTGTGTGRMSSGGGKIKKKGETKVVNLQNIINDYLLQNLAVPDDRWRKLFDALEQLVLSCIDEKYLRRLRHIVKKISSEKNKDKKYALNKELEAAIESLKKKIFSSGKFERLARKLVKKYGDIRILLGFDEGQIEVRVAAQFSGDKNLIKDCKAGDIHSRVGHTITGWLIEKIQKDKKTRTSTKNAHFGILFGLSREGLYDYVLAKDPDTTMTRAECERGYDRYFRRYRKIKELVKNLRKAAERTGYVVSMFGFKRKLNVSSNFGHASSEDEPHSSAYWGNQAINCVDFKTEALTQRGWVKGQRLRRGDVLLTKNAETNKLEWQSAQDVKVYPEYDSPLVKFSSKSFNAASTLDHRWLVGRNTCKTTSDLLKHKYYHIHRTGEYDGPGQSNLPDDVVKLVGWYLTDGYSRARGGYYGGHGFQLCQSNVGNPEKCKMIDELSLRLHSEHGFHVRTKLSKNRQKGEVFWSFSGGLASYLQGKFKDRVLTPQFLVELTKDQLEILLHTMILGDGWGSKLSGLHRNHKNGKLSFCTAKKRQADAFQMLCMLTGRACSVVHRDISKYAGTGGRPKNMTKIWVCNVLRRKMVDVSFLKHTFVENKGVWCPVVPNTYFVARRQGQVFVTGNTPIQGSAHQLMLMAMAMLRREPKKWKKHILGVPGIEVHDFMGWWTKLKNLDVAYKAGKNLLTKAPLEVVKKDFPKIKWKVPLEVEGKVGLRYGDSVEVEGQSLYQMLVDMFFATWVNEEKQKLELAKEAA